ncbi:MAG TPA: hypothetical protein VGC99_26445, partial [Candidatus Tectomicrobia bacterium]
DRYARHPPESRGPGDRADLAGIVVRVDDHIVEAAVGANPPGIEVAAEAAVRRATSAVATST